MKKLLCCLFILGTLIPTQTKANEVCVAQFDEQGNIINLEEYEECLTQQIDTTQLGEHDPKK